ncbi:MAG: hypothetical protein R3B09_18465 [Nannocystaceae bacterium]
MPTQRSFSVERYQASRYAPPHKLNIHTEFPYSGVIRLPNPSPRSSSAKDPQVNNVSVYFVVSEVTAELPKPDLRVESGEVIVYAHERDWAAWVDLLRNEKPLSVNVTRWNDALTTVNLSSGSELVGEGEG